MSGGRDSMRCTGQPDVSIVTATYRDPAALKLTAESLRSLKSTDLSWEHIIVDSSPEENVEVLHSLGPDWPLHHVVEPPCGVFSAQNAGSRNARGKYLWFLNGGDCLLSIASLASAVKILEDDSGIDLLACGVERVRDGEYQFCATPHRSFLWSILGGSTCLIHQGVIYRKTAFDRVGDFDLSYRIASDHQHYWRCYTARLGLKTSPLRLACFDVSGISETHYRGGFQELRRAHREIASQLPWTVRALNLFLFYYVSRRTFALKALQTSKYRDWLRPLWLSWKRRGDR
jgi:putative colanic acid biosynthesis glycosyltransferase